SRTPPSWTCHALILSTSSAICFCTVTPPPAAYTLSLHDALPISSSSRRAMSLVSGSVSPSGDGMSSGLDNRAAAGPQRSKKASQDRKSTRLNSSHVKISYAVFCLKKKKLNTTELNGCHTI